MDNFLVGAVLLAGLAYLIRRNSVKKIDSENEVLKNRKQTLQQEEKQINKTLEDLNKALVGNKPQDLTPEEVEAYWKENKHD